MAIPVTAPTQTTTRVALAEALLLRVGQMLEALVLGTAADGMTSLRLGGQVVAAKLPHMLPAGTVLQVQVRTAGATPELAVLRQSAPGPSPGAVRPPAPPGMTVPGPRGGSVVRIVPELVAMSEAGRIAPAPAGPGQARSAPALAPQTAAGQRGASVAGASSPMPGAGATAAASTAVPAEPAVVRLSAATPAAAVNHPTAQLEPGAQPAGAASPGAEVGNGGPATGPRPSGPVLRPAPESMAVRASPAAVPVSETALPQATPGVRVAIPPGPPASQSAGEMPPPAEPQPAAAPLQHGIAASAREARGEALLEARAMPRAPASAADLPRMPAPAPAAAPTRTRPPPATPQAAVAQALPQAMAGQNSAGPLLVSLAAALARPGLLPEPAARLARQVLAQRVVAGADGRPAPEEIARAVERSGVLLEARLAGGRGDPLDLKSLLLGLRDRLAATLPDGTQAPQRAAPEAAPQPAQPPLKGLPLRAAVGDVAPLPQEPKDALRMLHDQSDATVSRIKLAQIASLPDRADAGRANPVLLRLEVPLLFGHELVMAQIAVGRDGGRRTGERKRGWSFKFALKSAATGEVGADVGLLGRTVHVALWAADPRTAEVFSACLPELRAGLEGAGLTPASVQVRRGVPPAAPARSGELLDSMS